MNQQPSLNAAPRVLIVENDPRWRQDHKTNLIRWGYQPFIAQGQGDALLLDAYHKAKKHYCHLALVDMRLFDHDDRTDHSGLDLVPMLKPTQSIIISGYGDMAATRTALLKKGAKHFVGKEEGPVLLKQVLEETLQTICASKKNIQIEWQTSLSAPDKIIARLLPKEPKRIPSDLIEDILAFLFPNAKHLQLQRLNHVEGKTALGRSSVLKVYIDDLVQPEVVKIARAKDIKKESERYEGYIKGRLDSHHYARMESHICLWDIGAARYNFLGTSTKSLHSFTQHYSSHSSPAEITEPLTFFFNQLWHHYYSKREVTINRSLFEAYSSVWGTSWHKRLQTFARQESYLYFSALEQKRLNPVRWVIEKVGLADETLPDASLIPQSYQAITHGDLHGDNLFVDHGRVWIIDYERTGIGPILQDFVELEVNILNRLAQFKAEELPIFYQLVSHLIQAQEAEQINADFLSHHSEANKALKVIKSLRHLAKQKVEPFPMREYLWGLLFDSVFCATLQGADSQEREAQRERTLLLGSLICEQLQPSKALDPPITPT